MASVSFEKGTETRLAFFEFWELCQKYWIPEDSDEWWDEVIAAMDTFSKKYGSTAFVRGLALALTEHLEYEYRKRKEKSGS